MRQIGIVTIYLVVVLVVWLGGFLNAFGGGGNELPWLILFLLLGVFPVLWLVARIIRRVSTSQRMLHIWYIIAGAILFLITIGTYFSYGLEEKCQKAFWSRAELREPIKSFCEFFWQI